MRSFVTHFGGAALDEASEIEAGVTNMLRAADRHADGSLSRSDLQAYWESLGALLSTAEVAAWVEHALQLPSEIAELFLANSVTGFDFSEVRLPFDEPDKCPASFR